MATTETEYQNKILNKYLNSVDGECSDCCGAEVLEDTDICSECNEHCTAMSIGDYNYEEYENAMADRCDSDRELEGERDD